MGDNNHKVNNDPLAVYIDNLKSWHVALLYEEPEHARVIEFRFIRDGLKKGQSCCYIVHGNRDFIENQMADNGIDVSRHKNDNTLCVIESTDILNDPTGVVAANDGVIRKMCAKLSAPFRVVGGLSVIQALSMLYNSEVANKTTNAQLEIECNFHNQLFGGLQGYWLCPYSIRDIKAALNGGNYDMNLLMVKLLKSHDGAVMATKSGKGLSVFMP